jgi:hypothetical protein
MMTYRFLRTATKQYAKLEKHQCRSSTQAITKIA